MFKFEESWTDEIAAETTKEEYQNCKITIFDPLDNRGVFDVDTNEWEYTGDLVPEYVGRARIINVRWSVFSGGEAQANAFNISALRIQLPKNAISRVQKGWRVRVDEAPDNPALVKRLYAVSADPQGSASAGRTFEIALDSDAELKD